MAVLFGKDEPAENGGKNLEVCRRISSATGKTTKDGIGNEYFLKEKKKKKGLSSRSEMIVSLIIITKR